MSVDPRLINRTVHPELARGAITRACAFSGIPLHFARVSVQILLWVTNGQKTDLVFSLLLLTEELQKYRNRRLIFCGFCAIIRVWA